MVQKGAGEAIGFSDTLFQECGALIVSTKNVATDLGYDCHPPETVLKTL